MLHWLQPKMAPKNLFFVKLFLTSFLLHGIGCFMLLFVYLDYNPKALLQVSSAHSQAIVRVVSFKQKSKQGNSKIVGGASLKGRSVGSVRSQKTVLKKSTTKKIASKKQKQISKKTKSVKKQKEKTPLKKISALKDREKKSEPIVQEKKIDIPVKKSLEPIHEQIEPVVVENLPVQEIQEVSYQEFNFMQLQEAFQQAVARVWSPPAGMAGDLVCQVVLTVGWDGKLIEKRIDVPSHVLVYDIAVEQALEEIEMPSELWGKSVRVAFKP